MAASTHSAGPNAQHTSIATAPFFQKAALALAAFAGKIGTKAHNTLKVVQLAKMISTLSNMSDYQLAEIGITRSDIPKYAESLMADE